MSTPASAGTAPRSEPSATLTCPQCGQPNSVAPSDLFEGAEIQCCHCPAELMVERQWDEAGDTHAHWILVDAYEDDFDEAR